MVLSDLVGKEVSVASDGFSGKWAVRLGGKLAGVVGVNFSLKHAKPSGDGFVGVVTKEAHFPPGFDCASLAFQDGSWVWSCRDGRDGKSWDGSDVVYFNSKPIAGSCALIDIYDSI